MDSDQIARVVYLGLLLMAVGGWVLVEYRTRLGQALRVALAWGMIFLGVAAGYGLWGDLRRDIRPEQVATAEQVEIPRSQDGHYYLRLEVNGQRVQNGNTRNFIFGVPTVVAYISQFMTLEPGDIVLTGTPAGVGLGQKPAPWFLQPGDVVRLGGTGLGEQAQTCMGG